MITQNSKVKTQIRSSKLKTFWFLVVVLTFALCVLILTPKSANAGVILNAPKYSGLNQGLVGYWSFDGPDTAINASGVLTAYDRSGLGNNGGSTAAANTPERIEGKIGQGLSFDGVDDYVNMGDTSSLEGMPSLTISAWIKPTLRGSNYQRIVDKDSITTYSLFVSLSGSLEAAIVTTGTGGGSSEWSNGQFGQTVVANSWQHVVFVWDSATGQANIYKNGVAGFAQNRGGTAVATNALVFEIGKKWGSSETFNGLIDDVRIYNRALSPAEIKRLYNIGGTLKIGKSLNTGSLKNGLVGWWTFDGPDMAGNTAYDRSGYGHEGITITSTNSTWAQISGAVIRGSPSSAVVRTGSVGYYNAGTANTGNTTITVPSDATYIVVGAAGYESSTQYVFSGGSVTLNGVSLSVVSAGDTSSDGGANETTLFGIATTTGGNTGALVWDWAGSGVTENNTTLYYAFYKEVDPSNPIRDANSQQLAYSAPSATTGSMDAQTGDMAVAIAYSDSAGINWIGATEAREDTNGSTIAAYAEGNSVTWETEKNNGTLTSGPKRVAGKIGQGLSNESGAGRVNVNTSASLNNLSQMSVSFWVYPKRQGSFGYPIITKTTAGGNPGGWAINHYNTAYNRLSFVVEYDNTNLRRDSSNYPLTFDTWNYVVVTWDGTVNASNVHIYINTSEVSYPRTDNGVGNRLNDNSQVFAIGGGNDGGYYGLFGIYDDVRVYNRVLSAAEIKRLYNIGGTLKINKSSNTGSLKNGLVGWWTFDGPDMYGSTAIDRSGQGNNGTLTNGPKKVAGKIGQALSFNNVIEVIDVSPSNSLNDLPALTVSLWVKANTLGASGQSFLVAKNSDTSVNGWVLKLYTGNLVSFGARFSGTSNLGANTKANAFRFGVWDHWVVTWDGSANYSNVHFYRNGIEQARGGWPETNGDGSRISDSVRHLYIGNTIYLSRTLDGLIDDVRVYNRVLSADEIKRLYNMGNPR